MCQLTDQSMLMVYVKHYPKGYHVPQNASALVPARYCIGAPHPPKLEAVSAQHHALPQMLLCERKSLLQSWQIVPTNYDPYVMFGPWRFGNNWWNHSSAIDMYVQSLLPPLQS